MGQHPRSLRRDGDERDRADHGWGELYPKGRPQCVRHAWRRQQPVQQHGFDREPAEETGAKEELSEIGEAESRADRGCDEAAGDVRQIKHRRRVSGVALTPPEPAGPPHGKARREHGAHDIKRNRKTMGVGNDTRGHQHGRNAGKPDEAALHRMRGFRQSGLARDKPLQPVKRRHREPYERCRRRHQLSDEGRQSPSEMGGAPGAAEPGQAEHHAEEGCRHDR